MDENIIDEILEKNTISYEDRIRYKEIGRPTPPLSLTEIAKSRGKEYTRSFNVESYQQWDWLAGSPTKEALFCFPCLIFKAPGPNTNPWTSGFKCISRLKEKCDKHGTSKSHVANCVSLEFLRTRTIQRSLSTAYDKSIIAHNLRVDTNRTILRHILQCILFC